MKHILLHLECKKRTRSALFLVLALIFVYPAAAGIMGGTYVKDGVKHYYLTTAPYFLTDTNWQYDPNAGSNAYSKVKIHLCTDADIEEDNGCQDGDTWCWEGDGDSPCDCDDDEDYIPHEDNPIKAVFLIPVPLVIEKGMQVEIADEIDVVVTGSLTVNGTQEQPVSIDVGSMLEIQNSAAIDHCQIRNGNGTYGGGLRLTNCTRFSLRNSDVTYNKAEYGGGIFISGGSNIEIDNTEISGNNDSSRGGGLYIWNSSPIIRDCVIKSNSGAWQGGGVCFTGSGQANIINTRICDNSAQEGGGVYVDSGAAPVFVNAVICNNLGTSWGGGFYVNSNALKIYSSIISNNVVYGSYGGGMFSAAATITVSNTIVYDNLADWYDGQPEAEFTFQQVYPSSLLSGFSYCDIQNGGGVNSIDKPPRFAGASTRKGPDGRGADADWSLAADSPCINAGTEDELPATTYDDTDAVGNTRPYNKPAPGSTYYPYAAQIKVDIGAYEYQNNPALLLDENGNFVSGNISDTAATDEDTDITITLFTGYDALDVDGDPIETIITVFPDDVLGDNDDPTVIEFGQLFQYPSRDALNSGNNVVTNSNRRLIYNPANRQSTYSAYLAANFSDGQSPSGFSQTITISVAADNDPPYFITQPSQLQIYAGEQFDYSIQVDDEDVDDTSVPSLFIDTLPDWLSFWDNTDATGRLLGIASNDDIGQTDIVIWAQDGGGNGSSQAFSLTVDEQINLNVEVEKTSVSGAPGDGIVLKASSDTLVTNPSFDWTITDSDNNTLATMKGQRVTWDTTGMAEGTYTAEVTISDNRGSNTDSKTVTIVLSTSFIEIDDDNRPAPTPDQEKIIDQLDGDSPADVINDMSKLDLSSGQRDKVVSTIAEKSDDDLTEEETNQLLGALDNLIIADPEKPDDYLTDEQTDQALRALENIAADPDLTEIQLAKLGESIDELIAQKGRENLSDAQLAAIESIRGDLARAAAGMDRPMTVGGENFSLASQPVNATTGAGPLTIKTGNATVTIDDLDKLRDKIGYAEFCIILTHNTASNLADVPIYTLGLYTTSGELILFDDELETPLEIALPISSDSRIRPMYYEKPDGQWSNATIYQVASDEAEVSFKVTRFRDYGLFRSSVLTPEEAVSAQAAGGGSGGTSNCFLRTLFR